MSIIHNVRINQDIDKDGKYVCDLKPKEKKLSVSPGGIRPFGRITSGEAAKSWTLTEKYVKCDNTEFLPVEFLDIALLWMIAANNNKWKYKDQNNLIINDKVYISNLINELQKLV